jgi:hypothetical protein
MLFFPNESFTFVDNTPAIWSTLRSILHTQNISSLQLNQDPEIVFGGGLHLGEAKNLYHALDYEWILPRIVSNPMLGVEYVARRVQGQLDWYKKLQETAWAMVSEAFSEKVVVSGVTTTHVKCLVFS